MNEIIRTAMSITGWLLISFFAGISLIQKILPDMLFAVVSLRNRYGRRRGNILFLCRNLVFLAPGILLLILSRR